VKIANGLHTLASVLKLNSVAAAADAVTMIAILVAIILAILVATRAAIPAAIQVVTQAATQVATLAAMTIVVQTLHSANGAFGLRLVHHITNGVCSL
jgi:hypothetical protein